jgi:ribosomal-protein-alanine acetyltransferase
MKQTLKRWWFGLLGKDPEGVVVHFLTGPDDLSRRMSGEVRSLLPDRRHVEIKPASGSIWSEYWRLRREFAGYRIAMAPVLFAGAEHRALRWAAFLLAPTKILAYNARLERHHLQWRTWIASLLFLRGLPVDRIYLRPGWWPLRKDESQRQQGAAQVLEGRPWRPLNRRLAVLTPYVPYPLSHGGAVRMFYLLREAARTHDIAVFAFVEEPPGDLTPLLAFVSRIVIVPKPKYLEPRWSTTLPPEVGEYRSSVMAEALARYEAEWALELRQVEYTSLAQSGGDILVEHDVTFDLFEQERRRKRTLAAWWDWWRWRHFELDAAARFRRVIVMSPKDRALLCAANPAIRDWALTEIPNGVDLERFQPTPEPETKVILFVGSFRHFPNILAYRFFVEEAWPSVVAAHPEARLVVVAGPDPGLHWRTFTGIDTIPNSPGVELHGFIAEVKPFYDQANIVVVPTLVSAGTNLKVLEALAMQRAVVSTTSGCAGLGLTNKTDILIADGATAFAAAVNDLLKNKLNRQQIAEAGRRHALANFDWREIGRKQAELYNALLPPRINIRPLEPSDLPRIQAIQKAAPETAQWNAEDYLRFSTRVIEVDQIVKGYLVTRETAPGETEILNIAVAPDQRRNGLGARLLSNFLSANTGACFLEVRVSNTAARQLYQRFGFVEAGIRRRYYEHPAEDAIVMRREPR